ANGAVTLTVNLNVLNVDPAFTVGTPMHRAWGPGMGQQVLLPGVKVMARQRPLGGPLSTLFTAQTGADGVARLEVAKGLETSVCVALENDAAELSNFLTEIELCDFPALKADTDTALQLDLQHRHFSILAQVSEGRQYLRDVVDFAPHKARVLVGPLTWPFGRFTSAAVPCFGLPNLPLETAIDLVFAQVCSLSGLAAPACMALYPVYPGVDIVFAETEDDLTQVTSERGLSPGLYNWVLDSRLIPTHEYGHFALCSMLFKKDPATFMSAYSGAMLSRMDADPDETNVAGYINEGFADFFASQVAGGTNYFDSPDDDLTWKYGVLNYCVSTSASCLDSNPGKSRYSSKPFDDQVARVATTLHDAFDSWQPGGGLLTANMPGNGVAWKMSPGATFPLISNPTPPPDTKDELVRLPGRDIYSLITRLAPLDSLSDQSIMGGLSGMAREAGFNWCERCKLFVVNDKTFALDALGNLRSFSAAEMEARCTRAPIRDWLGPKPGNQQSCDVVSITGRVVQNSVPMAGVPVTLTLDGGLITRTTTDVAGAFRFDGLEPEKLYQLGATTSLGGFEYRATASERATAGVVKDVTLELVATVGARRATINGIAFLANPGDTAYQTVPFREDVVLDPMNPAGHFSLLPCGGPGIKIEVDARLLTDQSIEFSGQFDLFQGCGTGIHLDTATYSVTLPPAQTSGHTHSIKMGGIQQLHIGFNNIAP
ncbi:MAG TPA: carboxypeptidase-like regulatory domain-containing protein, partial [Myxococcaceae bacterium]|nr:carboxypeptidase-like regulatory domain-containing protein [Myxococcaceae bacterium]